MRLFGKVIQFGIPRSGSTLVYNITREIVPYTRVKKVHDLRGMDNSLPIVCTYRNPLDVMASLFESQGLELDRISLDKQIIALNLQGIWDLLLVRDRPNVLLLRYETFYCDVADAVRAIAAFLKISLSAERVTEIVEKFHIETVVQHTSTMNDFSEVDKKTGFHGNHVSRFKGEPGYYAEVFNAEQIDLIERSFYYFMQQFDY